VKLEDIPFNMKFDYGDDLREVPEDSEQMRKGLGWLQERLEETNAEEAAKASILLNHISGFARIMGDFDLAEKSILGAISILEDLGKKEQIFAMKLRMAIIFHYQKRFSKAEEIFSIALGLVRKGNKGAVKYSDFIFQHYAKLKFDQKFYRDAMDLFMEAYEARMVKGDLELLASTEHAITICRSKLEEP